MTDITTPKVRTITLTGRRPVTIQEDDWPLVASSSWKDWDNQYEFQANRTWHAWLHVRQHADSRAIVYGRYDYDTRFQGEDSKMYREGELLAAGDGIADAIERVGARLLERSGDEHLRDVIAECIADLPAESL